MAEIRKHIVPTKPVAFLDVFYDEYIYKNKLCNTSCFVNN